MPLKVEQPKYIRMINEIQRRIEDGIYPAGSAIPSESALASEFDVSRPTVVRALGIMQQDGWLDSERGKGRFVRSRSAFASRHAPSQAAALMQQASDGIQSELIKAGPVLVPAHIASVLGIEEGTPVLSRRRLVTSDLGPIELNTSYVPVELAVGAGLGEKAPIPEGLLDRLRSRNGADLDHATELIGARNPTEEEMGLLAVDASECLLTVLLTAHDRHGSPMLAVDVVIPASRHNLEDAFPLS